MSTPPDASDPRPTEPFLLGDWLVQPALDRLERGHEHQRLEPKVMAVLVALAARPGAVHSKEALLDTVWADTFVADGVLLRSISELRRALGDDARAPRYIETIPRKGYRLIATVASVAPRERDPESTELVGSTEGSLTPPEPDADEAGVRLGSSARAPRWILAAWLAVAAILAGVGWRMVGEARSRSIGAARQGGSETTRSAPVEPAETDDAMARAWAFLERGDATANASAIELFKRALEASPDHASAYAGLASAYARGVERFGLDRVWVRAAITAGNQAVTRAPDSAIAHLGLGRAHFANGHLRQAQASAHRAAELDPTLDAAWHDQGRVHLARGQLDEATRCLRRALDGLPRSAALHADLAEVYRLLGEPEHALAAAERSLALEPYEPRAWMVRARLAAAAGRAVEARDVLRAFHAVRPDHRASLLLAGLVEHVAGDPATATTYFRRARDATRDLTPATLYLLTGEGTAAVDGVPLASPGAVAQRAQRLIDDGAEGWVMPYLVAGAAALDGRADDALAGLQAAEDAGLRDPWRITASPALGPLVGDPRFAAWQRALEQRVAEMRRRLGTL